MTPPQTVVVVPARDAWHEYARFGVYICKARRSIRDVQYLAFYRRKQIEVVVPRIIRIFEEVEMSAANAASLSRGDADDRAVADLVRRLLKEGERVKGDTNKVFLLTQPDDADTVILRSEILHMPKGPWRQNWTYADLDRLVEADTTADL